MHRIAKRQSRVRCFYLGIHLTRTGTVLFVVGKTGPPTTVGSVLCDWLDGRIWSPATKTPIRTEYANLLRAFRYAILSPGVDYIVMVSQPHGPTILVKLQHVVQCTWLDRYCVFDNVDTRWSQCESRTPCPWTGTRPALVVVV